MNTNSFLIRGWVITLVSALFCLAAKDANLRYVMITYIVIPVFWILDGYYLSMERQYRALYDKVTTEENGDFSMNTKQFDTGNSTWSAATFSKTLLLFYGISFATTLTVMYLIKN